MKRPSENIRFYHDFGRNRMSKPWNTIILIVAILFSAFYIVKFIILLPEEKQYTSLITGLLLGATWAIYSSGILEPKGKFYFKITDEAIAYRIRGQQPKQFRFADPTHVDIHPGYVHFDTRDGMREVLHLPPISYKARHELKAALEEAQKQLIVHS
jgi:hypothetical protein